MWRDAAGAGSQQLAPSPLRIDQELLASCPLLCVPRKRSVQALPILRLGLAIHCHAGAALVQLQLEASVPSSCAPGELHLLLPKAERDRVTELVAGYLGRDEVRGAAARACFGFGQAACWM